MKKVIDILLLFVGIALIGYGGYSIYQSNKKVEKPEDPVVIQENNYIKYLEGTCWEKELISEETSDDRSKAICFHRDGTFTYKYLRGEKETVEGFEGYDTFKYDEKSDSIILYNEDGEEKELNIYTIDEKRLSFKYDNKLVYFLYYCEL